MGLRPRAVPFWLMGGASLATCIVVRLMEGPAEASPLALATFVAGMALWLLAARLDRS